MITKFSVELINGVKHFEGCSLKPYVCPTGHYTVGYGHLCSTNQKDITTEEANKLLIKDLDSALTKLYKYSPILINVSNNKVEALVSWVFNLGIGNYKSSTLKKMIDTSKWEEAANQITRWKYGRVKGKKVVLPGLVKRREWEKRVFLYNNYSL